MIKGLVYKTETLGAVDGPGLRYVLFMQGCNLRCSYCHNPESWSLTGGTEKTVDEVFEEIKKYKNFFDSSGGGLTVSGGEPMMQPEFVAALFKRCRENNIHTALDTSGYFRKKISAELVELTDLVLLDIKCIDPDLYRTITGVGIERTLEFAEYLGAVGKRTWIRHVLLPEINDDDELLLGLAAYLKKFSNIDRIELLPFHKMGERKWEEAGLEYKLRDMEIPTKEMLDHARLLLGKSGIDVI